MSHNRSRAAALSAAPIVLLVTALACGPLQQVTDAVATAELAVTEAVVAATAVAEAATLAPTAAPAIEATPPAQAEEASQWATSANASSQYGSDSWSALQATGAPDTTQCGDIQTAWATANSDGVDFIELAYPVAVIPTRIDIYQTYNPGAVVRVEVVDAAGAPHTVYEGQPAPISECPYVQTIDVTQAGIDFPVSKVIVHLDQTNHTGWNEIDAVQLTGIP